MANGAYAVANGIRRMAADQKIPVSRSKAEIVSPLCQATRNGSDIPRGSDGYVILYATPDFPAAFIEVIVRNRFTRKKHRELLLKEVLRNQAART